MLETLAEYYGLVAEVVEPLAGEIFDLAGDGAFVIFDEPADATAATQNAIRAALAIHQRGHVLIARWRKRGQGLGLKMALNSGFATLGHVRAGSYAAYAAVGSMVNATFHLDRVARDGEILATQRVADAAGGLALVIPRPEIELSALARKVEVFELRGLSD